MTFDTEVFLRRLRGLVSALALLQQSDAGSIGYAEFRSKVGKSVALVLTSVGQLLRAALKGHGESAEVVDALSDADVLRRVGEQGLLSAEEGARWSAYFDLRNSVSGKADVLAEEALTLLRALLIDARSLEVDLRSR